MSSFFYVLHSDLAFIFQKKKEKNPRFRNRRRSEKMSRTRHDLETLLESVYVKCNPAKLLSTPGFVKDVLDKYEGYHDCLVTKLKDKYDRIASFEIQKLDTFITSNQKNGT